MNTIDVLSIDRTDFERFVDKIADVIYCRCGSEQKYFNYDRRLDTSKRNPFLILVHDLLKWIKYPKVDNFIFYFYINEYYN